MSKALILLVTILTVYTMPKSTIQAQTSIKCGDIIEGEFTSSEQDIRYTITANAGDVIRVSGEAFGKSLFFGIYLVGPNGLGISRNVDKKTSNPSLDSDILSAKGEYVLTATNKYFDHINFISGSWLNYFYGVGIGNFTLRVSCTLRDGTEINPGDTIQPTPVSSVSIPPPAFGFPGLAPVDFKGAPELALIEGQPMVAAVAGNAVFISKLDATANEVYEVTVARSGGDASLGLTVLDPNNAAVFSAAMGTIDSFTVNVKIAATGTHTLGFYNAPLRTDTANATGVYTITVKKQ